MTTSIHGHPAFRITRRFALVCCLATFTVPAFATNLANTSTPSTTATDPAAAPALASDVMAMPATDTTPAPAESASSRVQDALKRAFSLLGTPYRWGGTSPDTGFDCSGLVGYVFRTIGIDLPRVSREMAGSGTPVTSRDALAKGDLVFFGRNGARIDHVGIYIGDGKFLHAPRTGRDVTVSSLTTGYWSQKFLQARRVAAGT